ncbi:DinB family protein [Intrasporangium sp. DVR]|uniref:DinB family protein n=1 Tax=Intrasporangium sp. DVR TaxID=3127867 RepID=UPI00333E642F
MTDPGRDEQQSGATSASLSSGPTRWTRSTVYRDMWVDPADDARESAEEATDERGILLGYLRYYRLTLEMKCADLDAEQLARRSVPPSTMSLLGIVRHMAEGERHLRRVMAGENAPKLYCTDEDRDGDWNGATADPEVVAEAWRTWRDEVERTDRFVAGVADLGTRNAGVSDFGPDGADLQLRDMLVAQVAEYARHCGHADLLRERIDGRVGQ